MNNADQFDQCLAMAQRIVRGYRAEAPEGCDPQNTMAWVAGISTVASAAVGIAGSVASSRAQKKQGQMADSMAQYNAHQQILNAQMQLMVMKAQTKLQQRMAEAQFRLRQSEANAHYANAAAIEQTTEAQSRVARESIRRKGNEYRRFQGTQRATIAASGLVESTGTPLDILAETAAQIQLEREGSLYTDELNRRTLFREADMERLGGKMALAGATLERSSALAEAGLNAAAGQAAYQRGLREAEITRLSGAAEKQSYYSQAQGTLFSGIASGIGSLSRISFGSGGGGYGANFSKIKLTGGHSIAQRPPGLA